MSEPNEAATNARPSGNEPSIDADSAEGATTESTLGALLERPTTQDLDPAKVREAFAESQVWVLGSRADDADNEPAGAHTGSESNILHLSVDDRGIEELLVPAFTSVEALRKALLRRPEWSDLSVLVVNGRELMDNVDPAVTIVINPLTRLEFEVPARDSDPEVTT